MHAHAFVSVAFLLISHIFYLKMDSQCSVLDHDVFAVGHGVPDRLTATCNSTLGYGVLAVRYDAGSGADYWKALNSWSRPCSRWFQHLKW